MAELSGHGYVHRTHRHNGASGKEQEVKYAEEENHDGGSALSYCRHGDGSGG